MIKRIFLTAFSIALLFSCNLFAQDVQREQIKFGRLLRLIDSYYVDSTDVSDLTEKAIVSMLSELDPHSVYISAEDVQKANEPLKGNFMGIGIQFNILNDTLMVVHTIPGGPSEKVGLRDGDRIITIDDENVAGVGLTNNGVRERLRGEKGTLVKIAVKRRGEKDSLDFDIIRGKIPINSMDAAYMVDKKTGYIKLNRFSANTSDEFNEGLKELKATGKFTNLIIDLRGNSGGYLREAFELVDELLDGHRMIVYTEGTKASRQEYHSSPSGNFTEGKVAILVDEGSASASEIVTGAIQDWDRGVVVGRRTFGKGLVQRPMPLTDGSEVRLTIAHYYTPSGRCIQKSYEEGLKNYHSDRAERYNDGELFNKDSIQFVDSLKYETLVNGRTVYGGGGIIPDLFIPLDTSHYYKYYNTLIRKNIVYPYITEYVDGHRGELISKYSTFDVFKAKYNLPESIIEDIIANGEAKEIERDDESLAFLDAHIHAHLTALIAKDLFGYEQYIEIFNRNDEEILEAIRILNDQKLYDNFLHGEGSLVK